jgi:hypothetical protein
MRLSRSSQTLPIALLFACLMTMAIPGRAQFSWGLGVHGGTTSLYGFWAAHLGGRVNVAVSHPIQANMALGLSAGYVTFGNRAVWNYQNYPLPEYIDTVNIMRLHQADAALTWQYRPWQRIEFALGVSVGANLRASHYTGVTYRDTSETHGYGSRTNATDQYYTLDIGLRPSAALYLRDNLALRLTYHQGLRNLSTLERTTWSAYTQAVFLGLDWQFLRPQTSKSPSPTDI